MTVYYILYFFIISLFFLSKTNLKIFKNKILNITLIFILLCLVVGLRNADMGNDLSGYIYSFKHSKSLSLIQFIDLYGNNYELGYIIFIKFLSLFTTNENIFLFFCSFMAMLPIYLLIIQKSDKYFLSILIFIGLPSFLMLFSALRQSIALSICCYSIIYIENKDKIRFILTIIIGSLFHSSALIFLIAYPIFWIKIDKFFRIVSIIFLLFVFVIRRQIFIFIIPFINTQYGVLTESNSVGIYIFLLLIYVFMLFFSNHNETNINGYLNILFLGIIFQTFASINSMAMRISEYFILILIVLIPKMLIELKIKTNKTILYFLFFIGFIALGLYFLYSGGSGWAKTYPYHWFWQ